VEALASLYHPEVRDALIQFKASEKNPAIIAATLKALASWPDYDPTPMLKVRSYHGMVVSAAIEVLGSQRRHSAVPAIMEALRHPADPLPAGRLGAALQTIAVLSRDTKGPETLNFLAEYLRHPHPNVRVAAARALGELGDPAALPILRSIASVKQELASSAANEAVAQVETRLKAPEQTQEVWKKVEILLQKTSELEKKLELLEKQSKPQ